MIFWLLLLAVAAVAQTAEQAQHPPTQKPQETEAKKPDPQNQRIVDPAKMPKPDPKQDKSLSSKIDKALTRFEDTKMLEQIKIFMNNPYVHARFGGIGDGSGFGLGVEFTNNASKPSNVHFSSVLARMHIQNTDNLASFFGGMYQGLSWVAFLMQFLFSGRLMNRWGLGLTIFILPLSLLCGSVVALMYPTLWAAILLRGSDQVFRHSIDRSTTEMLYLPIAPEIKIQAKSFIDTVVWRVGDALAAVVLMFFAGLLPTMNQTGVTVMNLLMVLPWLAIAYLTGREYVNNLRASLQRQNLPMDKFAAITLSYSLTPRQASRMYRQTSVNELLEMLEDEQTRAEAVRELYRRRSYLSDLEFAEEKIERILKAEIKTYRKRCFIFVYYHFTVFNSTSGIPIFITDFTVSTYCCGVHYLEYYCILFKS